MDGMLKQEGYQLLGAAMEVYNVMKHGYLENVYQECLERELGIRNVPFKSQVQLELVYKGQPLKSTYRPDLLVYGEIIVELKAIRGMRDECLPQILNYLKATGKRVGYLLNFGYPRDLEYRRVIL
jgi:GxxExxY protein